MSSLADDLRQLLDTAALSHAGTARGAELAALRAGLDAPLRVAIAGRLKAGKSTLLNALVGDAVAPTDAGECTRVVTWYRHGPTPRAVAHSKQVDPVPLAFRQGEGGLTTDLGDLEADELDHLVVDWPSAALEDLTLVDTPGLDSVNEEISARSENALGRRDGDGVDAVIYLLRHVHATDVRFLEAFGAARSSSAPIHCVGVLARADEVGAGRVDAMASAARVAARYREDPRLRSLCSTVVPVSALLAQAGTTLREDDLGALRAIAGAGAEVLDDLLLDASGFERERAVDPGGVGAVRRRELLDRFGLCGLRISLQLLRDGQVRSASELARALVGMSGLNQVRDVLATRFAPRRELLKARTALRALDEMLTGDPATTGLAAEVEALTAGAHELAEVSLLDALQHPDLGFGSEDAADAERLLGGWGVSLMDRLGLPADTPPELVVAAVQRELERWQHRRESPFAGPMAVHAARVLVRSCEALQRQAAVSSRT